MKETLRKALFLTSFAILLIGAGGVGSILFDHYFLPYLASTRFFSRLPFVKTATDNVTIIEKTEQVVVAEDDSIERIVSQPATTTVNIIALQDNKGGKLSSKNLSKTTTGVLVTNDGVIATVSDALLPGENVSYRVLLENGQMYTARVMGSDSLTNLSFLKIDTTDVPAISFANSSDARVGKKLIAIGNSSEEYQNRYATGILESKDRTFNLSGKTVASSEKWEGVFLFDVKNSSEYVGAPVVQWNGEMVGILGSVLIDNVQKYFVLPSNAIRESLELAIAGKLADRSTLGAYYIPLTRAYSIANGISRDRGSLVYSPSGKTGLAVLSGSPAEKAGLRSGDIILSVGSDLITLENPLSVLLGGYRKGDQIELTVMRNEVEEKISVQL